MIFKISLNKLIPTKTIADLKRGESGIVSEFLDEDISLKLIEMGCTPGCTVKLTNKAPLGGPVCVCIGSSFLSMRKKDAATIALD